VPSPVHGWCDWLFRVWLDSRVEGYQDCLGGLEELWDRHRKIYLTGHLHLPSLYCTNVMGNTPYSTSEHSVINCKDIISIISTRYHEFRGHPLDVLQHSTQ
jgi:hypothetical protein